MVKTAPTAATSFFIAGPAGQLQARQSQPAPDGALARSAYVVVIGHPHPQQSGTMDNKVVTTLMRTYRDLGITAISFNFRGVGESEGRFANGEGEREDLLAVVDWVRAQYPHATLLLAGFSFGSAMVAQASHQCRPAHLLLVAPPVERYDYDREGRFDCPVCVVQGDNDEVVDVSGVYRWAEQLASPVKLIRDAEAGHFFHGRLGPLKREASRELLEQLSA